MRWLRNFLRRWLGGENHLAPVSNYDEVGQNEVRVSILSVSNGCMVTASRYNPNTDRTDTHRTVHLTGEDMGGAIVAAYAAMKLGR